MYYSVRTSRCIKSAIFDIKHTYLIICASSITKIIKSNQYIVFYSDICKKKNLNGGFFIVCFLSV